MFESTILEYWYILIFLWTLLEWEVVMVMAWYLSQNEALYLPLVIMCWFLWVLTIDSYFFYLWYTKWEKLTRKIPQHKKDRVYALLKKRETLFIFFLRYLYWLRLISLTTLWSAKVSPKKFFTIYITSCIVWATILGTGWYYFGKAFGEVAKKFEINLIIVITLGLLIIFIGKRITKIYHAKKL